MVGNKLDKLSPLDRETLRSSCPQHVFTSTVHREDFSHHDFHAFFEKVIHFKGVSETSPLKGSRSSAASALPLTTSVLSPAYVLSPLGQVLRHRDKKLVDHSAQRVVQAEDASDIESKDENSIESKRQQ